MVTRNLRIVYAPTMPTTAAHFDEVARLRLRNLRRACFSSQLEASIVLALPLRSLARWESRGGVPGWVLVAFEQRARDLGVEPARAA